MEFKKMDEIQKRILPLNGRRCGLAGIRLAGGEREAGGGSWREEGNPAGG